MQQESIHLDDPRIRLRGPDVSQPRILVVEDDVDLMNIIVRIAKSLDPEIEVDWATNVDRALERIGRHSYNLILADYHLKGSKCGLTLHAPCSESQPEASFVMMSSMSFEDLWALPQANGIRMLRKPFTTSECLGFLSTALD